MTFKCMRIINLLFLIYKSAVDLKYFPCQETVYNEKGSSQLCYKKINADCRKEGENTTSTPEKIL
jgi:hypothetical protein